MYEFQVQTHAKFEAEASSPAQGLYRFAYTITITNSGRIAAQLVARHWLITDAQGAQQQVHGLGVVGRQPLLQPGESFTYSSACELRTSSGSMQGRYVCITEHGETFDTPIPVFVLDADAVAASSPAATLTMPSSRTLH